MLTGEWLAFTPDTTDLYCTHRFEARFSRAPRIIIIENGLKFVGPITEEDDPLASARIIQNLHP